MHFTDEGKKYPDSCTQFNNGIVYGLPHATIASKVIVLKKEEGGQVKNRNQSMNDHVPLKKGEIHSGKFWIFLTTSIQKGPITQSKFESAGLCCDWSLTFIIWFSYLFFVLWNTISLDWKPASAEKSKTSHIIVFPSFNH